LVRHWLPYQYLPDSLVEAVWIVSLIFVNLMIGYFFFGRPVARRPPK
jgi:hypothetical protein